MRSVRIALVQGARRLGALYAARDVLPGRYRFTVQPRGPGGDLLAAGAYRLAVERRRCGRPRGPAHVRGQRPVTPALTCPRADGCHLCEPAKATVREVAARFGVAVEEVDITRRCRSSRRAIARRSRSSSSTGGGRAKYVVDAADLEQRLRRRLAAEGSAAHAQARRACARGASPTSARVRCLVLLRTVPVRHQEAKAHVASERLTVGVAARLSRYLQVLTQTRKMGRDAISSQEISETPTSTRRRSAATCRASAASASAGWATTSTS